MKKQLMLVDEKRETLRINIKRSKPVTPAICGICGHRFDWLTVSEAAALFGGDPATIREQVNNLRKENEEHSCGQGDD